MWRSFPQMGRSSGGETAIEDNASRLRDELLGVLIGIARATSGNEHLIAGSTDRTVVEGLSAARTDTYRNAV